jgi:hypothetical protein
MGVGQGFGTTISFANGFFARVRSVQWSGLAREDVKMSSNDSPDGYHEFLPNDLVDAGELTIEMLFDGSVAPPIQGAVDTMTVNYAHGGSWSCPAYLKSVSAAVPYESEMLVTCVVKCAGKITFA